MKTFILSVVFSAICITGFAQTNTDSTKKFPLVKIEKAPLMQEKIWPLNSKNIKDNDSVIIKPRAKQKTRIKL